MTLIEVIDLARALLNEPLATSRADNAFPDDTSSFFTDTEIVRFINQAQRELNMTVIQSYENYLTTEADLNISANVDAYTLNTAVIKILRVEDIRNSPATEIFPISLNEKELYAGRFYHDLVNQEVSIWIFLIGKIMINCSIPDFPPNYS